MTQNQIAYQSLQENKRHNIATEKLSKRGQNIDLGTKISKVVTDISTLLGKALL